MGKYYRFDYKGNLLVDKTFDEISTYSNLFPEFSTVRKGKKWGLAKTDTLEIVIDIKYDRMMIERFDFPLIRAWENEKVLLLDAQNNILVPPKYDNIDIINGDVKKYSDKSYAVTTLNKRKGLINLKGEEIIPPEYLDCEILPDDRFLLKKENSYVVVDIKGSVLHEIEAQNVKYINSMFYFKRDGKIGYLDKHFNVAIVNIYDDIVFVDEDIFIAKKENKNFVLNKNGEIIKAFDFSFVVYNVVKLKDGKYNYVIAKDNSYEAKQGLLNHDFELVIPIECNWFTYNEDVWVVRKGRSYYLYGMDYMDMKGIKYKEIGRYETSGISCTVDDDGKYRFIDKKGVVINQNVFDNVYLGDHSNLNGLFSQGLLGVKVAGKWGFINDLGNIAINPDYDEIKDFDNLGNARVKKNGKWGLINSKGEVIIDFHFDVILDYDLERQVIKSLRDKFYGLINFSNETIIPFLADGLWLNDDYIDVRAKKSVFKKQDKEKKSAKPEKEKIKVNKPVEPVALLEKKYVKYFDEFKHPDIVRAMILSVAEESSEGYFKIYIIDFVKRDGSTATYINGYAGGGEWESFEFNNETIYEGGNDGISAFHLSKDDEKIHSLFKDYLCEFDEEADEYKFQHLNHFEKTGVEQLMVLNAVWYEKDFDYSEISKNDRKRFKNLLKQTGLLWNKWNFKF